MRITDEVYGDEEINEPVLIELINSKPIQRLKEINQYGLPDTYYHKKNFSRYEHSIGVLILLRRFGANLKEQIAGLLHDISHTAFSHVVDWVIGDSIKEDFQDKNHLSVMENSEIPALLEKYKINFKEISELEYFSLLENHAPDICADRIDYTLRELKKENKLFEDFMSSLMNYNGKIIFNNPKSAKNFAFAYLTLQKEHWAGDQARMRYCLLSRALRIALDNKLITLQDLYKTDLEVMGLLEKSSIKEISDNLNLLKNNLTIRENSDSGVVLKKKFRYIDPEFLSEGKLVRVSSFFKDYKQSLEIEKQNSGKEKRVSFEVGEKT